MGVTGEHQSLSQVHPDPLRGVLALAEGRGAVHRRPPRRGRLPDRRGARAPRQHLELDGRALLPGARVRGLPRAAGRGARRVPARARHGRQCHRSANGSSAPLFSLDQNEFETALAADHLNVEETARKVSRARRRGADRGDRQRREGARGGHRPDGVLRQLPAPPADAAGPARGGRRKPLPGGAQPPRAHRLEHARDRALRRAPAPAGACAR